MRLFISKTADRQAVIVLALGDIFDDYGVMDLRADLHFYAVAHLFAEHCPAEGTFLADDAGNGVLTKRGHQLDYFGFIILFLVYLHLVKQLHHAVLFIHLDYLGGVDHAP